MNWTMSSKGLSLVQITKMFPSDEAAECWFVGLRWSDGLQCPRCECPRVATVTSRRPMPYRCRAGRMHFSVRTNTLTQNSRLGLQVCAVADYLMSAGIKGTVAMKLRRDFGIAYMSIWRLALKIRETWRDESPRPLAPSRRTTVISAAWRKTSTPTRGCEPAAAPSAKFQSLASETAPQAA